MARDASMELIHLCSTPADPRFVLQRVNRPLSWAPQPGCAAPDGQMEVRNGLETLLPQPHQPNKYMGVSFFVPQCDDQRIVDAIRNLFIQGDFKYIVSVPNTPLPRTPLQQRLLLVNDHTFNLRLLGQERKTIIGQHYTLFVDTEMPVSVFTKLYNELIQTFQQYNMVANSAADVHTLLDPHVIPTDRRSAMAVQALEALAEQTADQNTALFATLFAVDMRACNTDFEEVLNGCSKRAMLIALAMDQYVVRDPLLHDGALDVQEALEEAVPGYKAQWCTYKPFWE